MAMLETVSGTSEIAVFGYAMVQMWPKDTDITDRQDIAFRETSLDHQ